jgi:phytoene dehydrogenase-like protein
LTQLSPEDAAAIRELTRNIKAFGKLSIPVTDIKGVRVKQRQSPPLSMLFAFFGVRSRMKTLDSMTTEEYIECFRHPAIRALLSSMIPARGYSAASLLFTLGGLANGDGGYPEGGSLRMAQNMAGTFESAGGTIQYGVRVEKVDVADGRARGVWAGGEFHEADAVIVTSDTRVAIDSLLDNPLDELWANELRSDITPLNCTFICLGVKADLNAYPEELNFPISRPFTFAGVRQEHLGFNNYASYPGYAPEGCTALTAAFCEDSYDEWKKAKEDGSYERKKKELADLVIDRLAEAVPEIAGNVEVWDIATPLTYERYCGTWRGSWMSVLPPNCKRQMFPTKPETIESLYLAGHRLHLPGGLPTALMTAREAVQHLCKDTDTVFQGCMSENIIKKF